MDVCKIMPEINLLITKMPFRYTNLNLNFACDRYFSVPVLQGVEEAFYSLVREIRRYKETNRSNKKSKKNTQRRCIIL